MHFHRTAPRRALHQHHTMAKHVYAMRHSASSAGLNTTYPLEALIAFQQVLQHMPCRLPQGAVASPH